MNESDGAPGGFGGAAALDLTPSRAMIQHHPDFYSIDTPMHKGGIEMGARCSICRLPGGKLWVHAPLAISEDDQLAIQELGQVAFIVVPNTLHFTQVGDFTVRFPEATVYAPASLESKLKSVPHRNLDENAELFARDFDAILFDTAPLLHEWVFCHRASRTLLLTDLCFNVETPENLVGRVGATALDLGHGLAPSRALRIDLALGDRDKTRELIDTVLGWDFDRVSVAHGAIVESGGKEALRTAFEWLEKTDS